MEHRKELDGIRTLAIIPTILYHAGFSLFSGGFAGVDVFFVISGYLISNIIISDIENGSFSIANFYERRIRRILPALFLIVTVTSFFALFVLSPFKYKSFAQSISWASLAGSNVYFFKKADYFNPLSDLIPLLHTWTLGVEEQFYFIFPFFLIIIQKFGKRKMILVTTVLGFLSLFAAHLITVGNVNFRIFNNHYYDAKGAYFLLPTRGWALLMGALASMFASSELHNKTCGSLKYNLLSFLGFLMIVFSEVFFSKTTPWPSFYSLLPGLGTCLVILYANKNTIMGQILSTRIFVGIGLVSYSAYLWHQPVFSLTRNYFFYEKDISNYLKIILIIITFILSYLSWRFVEVPFRKKEFLNQKKVFAFGLLSSFILLFFGLYAGYLKPFKSTFYLYKFNGKVREFLDKNKNVFSDDQEEVLDELCNRYVKMDVNGCLFGDLDKAPEIVIVGDSHSRALFLELSKKLRENNMSALGYWGPYCAPVVGQSFSFYESNGCREFVNKVFEKIFNDKKIKIVIWAAFWSNYFTFSSHSLPLGDFSLSEAKNSFSFGFQETFNKLLQSKKDIIFVKDVPTYNVSIPRIVLEKLIKFNDFDIGEHSLSRETYGKQNFLPEQVFKKLNLQKNSKIIETVDLFCKKQSSCSYIDENQMLYYYDAHHITEIASVPIVKEIMKNIISK